MFNVYVNVLNESEKLWAQRKTKLFLSLSVFVPVTCALILYVLESNTGIMVTAGANFSLLMLQVFTFAVLPLFLFMAAADLFSGEAADRSLKLGLVRPITRHKVFASKVLAIGLYVVFYLVVLWHVSFLVLLFLNNGNVIVEVLTDSIAYVAAVIPMLSIGILAVFIAQWFKSSTGALTTCVIIYAIAQGLPFVLPTTAVWSVFSYTNWHMLWVNGAVPFGQLINGLLFLTSYGIIAYTLGLYLFQRKQL
jgi:ABC-2 type transport system permease protein